MEQPFRCILKTFFGLRYRSAWRQNDQKQNGSEDGRLGKYQLWKKQTIERKPSLFFSPPPSLLDLGTVPMVAGSSYGHRFCQLAPAPRPQLWSGFQEHHSLPLSPQALGWWWLPTACVPGESQPPVISLISLIPLWMGPLASKDPLKTLTDTHCTTPRF